MDDPQLQSVAANIHDDGSRLAGAYGVVNAVSLYVEHGQETFHSVHVESAQRVATQARRAGSSVSPTSQESAPTPPRHRSYIRERGEGELAVRAAFTDASPLRPAVMFGPDDSTTIVKLLRRLPIYPMFGRGLTRLQPAYVEDVAEAIARALQRTETHAMTYECAGPRVYSYEQLLRTVAHEVDRRPTLIPIPFAAWHALAWLAEMLPSPPLTRNQVELMQVDNVPSPEAPGFADPGISPQLIVSRDVMVSSSKVTCCLWRFDINQADSPSCTVRARAGQCPFWVISGHFRAAEAMSALPPKADMCTTRRCPRQVPKSGHRPNLFDHLGSGIQ